MRVIARRRAKVTAVRFFQQFDKTRREPDSEQAAEPPTTAVELIVGLGNPGGGYAGHRHNVGYWVVNRLGKRLGIEIGKHSGTASVGEGTYNGHHLILAKPRTFMNTSGDAIRDLLRRYRVDPSRMLIVHDDLDMPVGKVRLRAKGSHGGNNGMKSIIARIGTQDFPRLKIGIGRPTVGGEPSWDPEVIAGHVLAAPPPDERAKLDEAATRAGDAIIAVLDEGIEAAMNRFNRE